MSFKPVNEIKVGINFGSGAQSVGRLAIRDRVIYFEYDSVYIERGLDLSPLRLPLRSGVQEGDLRLFEGLPGLFNDSLPDGWGRLLFDRSAREQGILADSLSPLDRLAHVGARGMGALTYMPDYTDAPEQTDIDLDALAQNAQSVLHGSASDVLEKLLSLNGSSAGARPKALIGVNPDTLDITHGEDELGAGFEPWLVKFANTHDGLDAGAIEYVYAAMARKAGIDIMPTLLFPAEIGAGYFATKRFDRDKDVRFHTHTVCGLLHSDFRTPSLDYQDLLTLTLHLNRMWGRLKSGYWVFQAPTGYKYEKVGAHGKLLVRNEPIASAIKEALEGYASGRLGSLVEIKRFLDKNSVFPKDKTTGEVAIQRMRKMVTQPLYAGYIEHEGWSIPRIKGHHAPIVSLDVWQKCQDRLNGNAPSLPTKVNLNELMPLRGFAKCGCCDSTLSGGRSKGRNKYYVYYECFNKNCDLYRKSIPKAKIEGAFEGLLTSMKPSETLFKLLYVMLKDLWDAQASNGADTLRRAKKELQTIESDIERLVDRTLDTSNATLTKRYEQHINELETKKMILAEKQGQIGKPQQSFEQVFRTAMQFLSNPLNLWKSSRLEDKRAVLKLTFSDQLSYHQETGFRTANLSLPFKVLGSILGDKKEMVPPHSKILRGNKYIKQLLRAVKFYFVAQEITQFVAQSMVVLQSS